jgi:phosphomevalonate kinase
MLGGLVEYSMGEDGARRLGWPDGLHMAVFWLGIPVSTGERLEQLGRQPARPSREALVHESGRMATVWAGGSAQVILAAYPDYINALREFSADYGLGIFDAGHAELAELAESAGVVYKPCGAGGGDCGVCLSSDSATLDAFIHGVAAKHAHRPDIGIDDDGVRVGSEAA